MADGSLKFGKLSTVRTVMNQTLTNCLFLKKNQIFQYKTCGLREYLHATYHEMDRNYHLRHAAYALLHCCFPVSFLYFPLQNVCIIRLLYKIIL